MSGCLPKEQAGDLFHEDWDLELKADQGNPYGRCRVSGVLGQALVQSERICLPVWEMQETQVQSPGR